MLKSRGKRFDRIFATLKTYSKSEGERLRQSKIVLVLSVDVWNHTVLQGHTPVHYSGTLLCSCGKVWDIFGMFPPACPNVYFPQDSGRQHTDADSDE